MCVTLTLQVLMPDESAIDLNIGPPISDTAKRNYQILKEILIRLAKLCMTVENNVKKPRRHEQRLLRNMGAHAVVLELLKIPYDKHDTRMQELLRLAHSFLQCFCLGNHANQGLLHKHLDLFLNPGVCRSQVT
jgi:inositol 1,4,5-triphosphate receptor type 1